MCSPFFTERNDRALQRTLQNTEKTKGGEKGKAVYRNHDNQKGAVSAQEQRESRQDNLRFSFLKVV